MDIWDDEEEEEDDWNETDPEMKATADKEDDDSQFFKELEAIAKVAEKADFEDPDEDSDEELRSS